MTDVILGKRLLFLLLVLIMGNVVNGQEISVSGMVTDIDDIPLPGVNVSLAGEDGSIGTTTDFDGNYTFSRVPSEGTLVFSYLGYETKRVRIEGRSTVDVSLELDTEALGEVVVVGYGAQKRKVSSAATEFVKSEDLLNSRSASLTKSLQGQTAGVNITESSGQPGSGMRVNIRGVGTIGNNNPLYVVDGMVIENGIDYIDPSTIERIDVLKDAAASSIYGARAANGVILVTTKSGREGKMNISINSYAGFQEAARTLDLLNSQQYALIMNEARVNSGMGPLYSQEEINTMPNQNWQKKLFTNGAVKQNHSLNIVGGSEKATYKAGLTYYDQDGLIGNQYKQSNYNRIAADIKMNINVIPEVLTIGENITYSRIKNKGVSDAGIYDNSIRGFLNAPPNYLAIDENGEFGRSTISNDIANPLGNMYYNNFNENIMDRVVGNIFLDANFLNHFNFKSSFGIDQLSGAYRSFLPVFKLSDSDYNNISSVTQNSNKSFNWSWENTLDYETTIGLHHIDALLGMSARKNKWVSMGATGRDLIFDDFKFAYLDNTTRQEENRVNGSRDDYMIYSYFGRVFYDFDERYLFTATIRRDASSEFGPRNKYAYFPSFSLGWNLDREAFYPDDFFINKLKIRGSWGQNGNDQFGQKFAYASTINSIDKNYHFGTGDDEIPLKVGSSPDMLANPDLKWETSEQLNIGFDATLFTNLDVTFDVYNKLTRDWIVQATTPKMAGAQPPFINGGNVKNSGVEASLNYHTNFNSNDWKLSAGANISYNRNRVTKVDNENGVIFGDANLLFQGIDEINRVQVGHPIGFFYGLETDGIFQSQEEIENYSNGGVPVQPNAKPGDVRFVDQNGDGKIDQNDKKQIGDPNPDINYGFNFSITYKAFDFSLYAYGMTGFQNAFGIRTNERPFYNYDTSILDRWTGPGTSDYTPRVTYGTTSNGNYTRFSDLYLEKGDFLRIKTVNVGVNLAEIISGLDFFNKLRVYVSANNLFTFTKYSGYDPEIGFGNVNQSWSRGIDVGFYPQPRTYLFGVELNF